MDDYCYPRRLTQALLLPFLFLINILHSSFGEVVPVIEPELVHIEAGSFIFGTTPREAMQPFLGPSSISDEEVYLDAYSIGKYEVSNTEFAIFIKDGGYRNPEFWSDEGWEFKEKFGWIEPRRWRDREYTGYRREDHPVSAVSWYEAEAYCRWLSLRTDKPYRLPTEREWEKAARGTDGRIYPWGNQWEPTHCNWLADADGDRLPDDLIDGYAKTAPIDSYPEGASPYGCHNMAGNVLEWCSDVWSPEPKGLQYRVYRGGCFLSSEPRLLRCSWRGGNFPQIGHVYWGKIGFRVACDIFQE